MERFCIARNNLEPVAQQIRLRASVGKRLFLSAAALPALVVFAGLSAGTVAAQECSNCKIPSGYTTEKGTSGGGCVNKLVACTCTPPGGKPTKSSQEMCLYRVSRGGNLHAVGTPSTK
jgi:hypothetical protein